MLLSRKFPLWLLFPQRLSLLRRICYESNKENREKECIWGSHFPPTKEKFPWNEKEKCLWTPWITALGLCFLSVPWGEGKIWKRNGCRLWCLVIDAFVPTVAWGANMHWSMPDGQRSPLSAEWLHHSLHGWVPPWGKSLKNDFSWNFHLWWRPNKGLKSKLILKKIIRKYWISGRPGFMDLKFYPLHLTFSSSSSGQFLVNSPAIQEISSYFKSQFTWMHLWIHRKQNSSQLYLFSHSELNVCRTPWQLSTYPIYYS